MCELITSHLADTFYLEQHAALELQGETTCTCTNVMNKVCDPID